MRWSQVLQGRRPGLVQLLLLSFANSSSRPASPGPSRLPRLLVQIIGLDNSDGLILQDMTLNIRMSEAAAFAVSCCQRGNKRGVAVI